MLRVAAALLLIGLAGPARTASIPDVPPFHPSRAYSPQGPAAARGAVVWLHGGYDSDEFPHGPPEPAWIARLAAKGWDVWRFDRPNGDPLRPSEARLAEGARALKAVGYARIAVGGQSRGGFIALAALRLTGVVDAVVALSPAAHGTRPERRPRAMADFEALMAEARPMRFAFVQLADDPFDLDDAGRLRDIRDAAARAPLDMLVIDCPPEPTGHMGTYEPAFDTLFGECLANFTNDGTRDGCPPL